MRDAPVIVTKIEGGTIEIDGKTVFLKRHCIFDGGPQGTAHIYVMQETCSEEQRLKNRAALDEAVRSMYLDVMRNRAKARAAMEERHT